MWWRRTRLDTGEQWAAIQRRIAADLDWYRARLAELRRQLEEIGPDLHEWEYRNGAFRRKPE